ncbi:MAG TPA: hypothetical protein PLF84_22365, partial [Bryobacteraceae bacterium]|nr:hypothetical protein [Bryobacteraceae bacterium]
VSGDSAVSWKQLTPMIFSEFGSFKESQALNLFCDCVNVSHCYPYSLSVEFVPVSVRAHRTPVRGQTLRDQATRPA